MLYRWYLILHRVYERVMETILQPFSEVMACIEAQDADAFDAAMARLTAADDQLLAALRTVLS